MRAIWSGTINFGLVNIPVKLYSAVDSEGLGFNYLHKKDLSPVGYMRVCRKNGEEVPYKDIVKGYEYSDGDYVVLTDEDFKKADVKKTTSITIEEFVNEKEIDTSFFEQPYFLEPDKKSEKVYALLCEALKKVNKVGVARFVLRTREHMAILKPVGGVLVLNQIRFANELRSPDDLNIKKDIPVSEKEIEMAISLIEQLSSPFNPKEFKDTYAEELKDIIDKKAKGELIRVEGEEEAVPTDVSELMDKLKESLKKARKKQNGHAYVS